MSFGRIREAHSRDAFERRRDIRKKYWIKCTHLPLQPVFLFCPFFSPLWPDWFDLFGRLWISSSPPSHWFHLFARFRHSVFFSLIIDSSQHHRFSPRFFGPKPKSFSPPLDDIVCPSHFVCPHLFDLQNNYNYRAPLRHPISVLERVLTHLIQDGADREHLEEAQVRR